MASQEGLSSMELVSYVVCFGIKIIKKKVAIKNKIETKNKILSYSSG
jgi:hypothetical protein